MRNPTLHELLQAFTTDAAMRLSLATADGDEIPFEVVPADGGRVPLYCYRPLTSAFIRSHLGLLAALPTYAPAARALAGLPGVGAYLRARGEARLPEAQREQADMALRCFLARVFEERSEFGFDDERYARAYEELERWLYDGRSVTEFAVPLHGLALAPGSDRVELGDGLSLVPSSAAELPFELDVGPEEAGGVTVLVLRVTSDRHAPPPRAAARARFRRTLTAIRLFEAGSYALGQLGVHRIDDGPWSPVAIGSGGGDAGGSAGWGTPPTLIAAEHEDELRAFCNLVARRLPAPADDEWRDGGDGELAWALARFELGCDRPSPLQALTDHLLALRALLEPEGPASGRLAQRLAVICAAADGRAALARRTAHAIALERAVIAGATPSREEAATLVGEIAEHLRAILRDVVCGHLDADLCAVADDLLASELGTLAG